MSGTEKDTSTEDGIPIPRRLTWAQLSAIAAAIAAASGGITWIATKAGEKVTRDRDAADIKTRVETIEASHRDEIVEDKTRDKAIYEIRTILQRIESRQEANTESIRRIMDRLDRKDRAAAGLGVGGAVAAPPG